YVEKGCDIVYIGISSEMSGTVQNARMAAREYPQATIRCVDSRSLSTGIGLQVLMACDLAAEGKSANEIADTLECKTERVRASFVVDQMSFLYYGGRCSAVQAFGASLLNLRPQISVKDGRMYPTGKYRGNITRVARIYAEHALHDISRIVPKRVFITYSQDTDAAVVQAVRDVVTSKKYFEQILETEAGCVVTSHCGRNCIGVLFMEKE
ncbi:MAG: DegV family protein, partial [Clostridia bacterium]